MNGVPRGHGPEPPATDIGRRCFDVGLAGVGTLLLLPLWALMAVAIWAESGRPLWYRAVRVGRGGRPFALLKFRSMRAGTGPAGAALTRRDDPRITRVGQWLRRTHLDETPQLLNVLRGDMNLVGPRPEDPRYVARYDVAQQRLLTVRPGLTSVASLAFRHESALLTGSADEVEHLYLTEVLPAKLALELQYLAQRTWGRDMATLLRSLACSVGDLVGPLGRPGGVAAGPGRGRAAAPPESAPPSATPSHGPGQPPAPPEVATADPPPPVTGPDGGQRPPAGERGAPPFGAAHAPLTYWRRYLAPLRRYGTPRKFVNLAGAGLSYILRRPYLHSRPAFLKVELCRRCDVNCLYCAAEWYHSPFAARPSALYPLPAFQRLIDALAKDVFFVSLYDIGEPLHHPQVLECIRYAHDHRLGTVVSSSLSLTRDEGFWRDLVTSGLDLLIVAIDGVTPEVYRQYRRNGRFDLVMANLRTILAQRQQTRARLAIEWQMVDLPWNRAEQAPARALAHRLGCDRFRVITEATGPRRQQQAAGGHRERGCVLPYVLLFVGADQRARACYKVYNQDMSVGSLADEHWTAIWNGTRLAAVRDRRTLRDHQGCCTCRE